MLMTVELEHELTQADKYAVSRGLEAIGIMFGIEDKPAGPSNRPPLPMDGMFSKEDNGGYEVIRIPPELFNADVFQLAQRIVVSVYHLEPPRNPLMSAVYRMLSRLADERVETTCQTVVLGLLLGAAKVHGVRIKTHPRDLARDVGVRYAVLLKVRRAAIAELTKIGGNLL